MKIILFDLMDTVIVDPYRHTVEDLTPANIGVEDFQKVRNMNSFFKFEKGELSELDFFANYYSKDFDFQSEGFPRPQKIKKYLYRQIRYINGMKELLGKLKEDGNIRTGIASNYSTWYLEIFRNRRDLENLFDYLFFSCEMGVRKPDPHYFKIIQDALFNESDLIRNSDEIFFIDDRRENIIAAEKMGWVCHHFESAAGLGSFFMKHLGRHP